MRRSRRKGQSRRTRSIAARSQSTIRVSSSLDDARASTRPKGSATKDWPQKRMSSSRPTRFTAATNTPLAMAWDALHGLPGVVLGAVGVLALVELPADRGRVEQDLRPAQGGQARGLGEPLVPADQRPYPAVAGDVGLEAEVARREVELLVVEGVVRDVHLPVATRQLAIGVEGDGGVVVQARGAALEEAGADHHPALGRQLAQGLGGRAGDGLRQVEAAGVLALAEVAGAEELREADQLGAVPGRPPPRARGRPPGWRPGRLPGLVWTRATRRGFAASAIAASVRQGSGPGNPLLKRRFAP